MSENEKRVELIPGTQAVPRNKSMAHRMFFKPEEGHAPAPVKGEFVSFSEGEKIYARLFVYHLEGPPYTAPQGVPGVADPIHELTGYEVTAINAVHAREQVITGSVRVAHATSYGPAFTVLMDQLEKGCPEWGFGKVLADAFAEYDTMVESSESYEAWEAAHSAFAGRPSNYYEAMRPRDGESYEVNTDRRDAVLAQSRVLAKHFGGGPANIELHLALRAHRSEHWQEIAKPALEALEAQAEESVAKSGRAEEVLKDIAVKLAENLKDLYKGLDQESLDAVAGAMGYEGEVTAEKILELVQAHSSMGSTSLPPFPTVVPGVSGSGGDWVELAPGPLPGLASDWVEITPGMPMPGTGVPFNPGVFGGGPLGQSPFFQPMGASQAEDFLNDFPGIGLPEGAPRGVPFPGYMAPPGMKSFAPGPGESFTMGDGAEGQSPRHLEAAVAEADALRARLHSDANERKRKLGLFKDVVSGGLHWLLEKAEGAPAPVPAEPVGPVEQIMGRTGVNGSRPGVLKALDEMIQTAPLSSGAVGAPGESF